jgi:hypothetical protein
LPTLRSTNDPVETHIGTPAERRAWWSGRRRRYNILLIVAAPISAAALLAVWALFEERLPCLEITGFSLVLGALLFVLALGMANACYFLGPLSERVIRPRNVMAFRRWSYGLGVAFSLLLIFLPVLTNLIAASLGRMTCVE